MTLTTAAPATTTTTTTTTTTAPLPACPEHDLPVVRHERNAQGQDFYWHSADRYCTHVILDELGNFP